MLKVAKISKAAERVVRKCKALLFDAIHERINELNEMSSHRHRRQQVNEHGFKRYNRVACVMKGIKITGYCVRVTKKYVYFVRFRNIFDVNPLWERVKSEWGVTHVHPYIGNKVENVKHWRFMPMSYYNSD